MEFALVSVLFFMLLFAIISFGILLSFKQNMTQAASESARAAIAVVDDDTTPFIDERVDVAKASMAGAISEFDRECGLTASCEAKVHACSDTSDFSALPATPGPEPHCITTRLEFENTGSSRILPPFPIIAAFEPERLSSQTTVRLVPVPDSSTATTPTTASTP